MAQINLYDTNYGLVVRQTEKIPDDEVLSHVNIWPNEIAIVMRKYDDQGNFMTKIYTFKQENPRYVKT